MRQKSAHSLSGGYPFRKGCTAEPSRDALAATPLEQVLIQALATNQVIIDRAAAIEVED